MNPIEQMLDDGYSVWRQRVDRRVLYDLVYHKADWDRPVRGHDRNGVYYDKYQESVEWANYWTPSLSDHIRLKEIRQAVDPIVKRFLVFPVFYHADVSVLTPLNSLVRPHVDTPHRHEPWNHKVKEMNGIQVAIPLHDMSDSAGSTAFLPKSYRKAWDIKACYRGEYTAEFLAGCDQPDVRFGDILLWDSRTLHSQMPNVSHSNRYMLLLNYLEERIVDRVMEYEASLLHA